MIKPNNIDGCDVKTTCGCYLLFSGNILLCHATGFDIDKGWGIPKGLCDPGETPEDAMFREVYEETNIVLAEYSYKWMDCGTIYYNNKPKILHGYAVVLSSWDYPDVYCASTYDIDGMTRPEIDGYLWLPIEEGLKKMNYTQNELWNRNALNIERLMK